jgi:hypothetical protein
MPSISINTVECPSHVARNPLSGALRQASSGLTTGKRPFGTRRCPPHIISFIIEAPVPFLSPVLTASVL